MSLSRRLSFLAGLTLAVTARADVTLAPLFQDHMVLQRDKRVPVWGHASPGENVVVEFAGQKVVATADREGRWMVSLAPLATDASARELVVTGENKLILHDVVVGEVWLCSGQSNMEWRVGQAARAEQEIVAGNWPLIRQFKVKLTVAETPRENVAGAWTVASPATVAQFTAVGYFFGRELHQRLEGIPIGLVNCTWGGTQIESWLSAKALAGNPAFDVVGVRWRKALTDYPVKRKQFDSELSVWTSDAEAARIAGRVFDKRKPQEPAGPGHRDTPGGLFNAMVNPLVPYAIRGAIWYQGESNAGRAAEYHALFAQMITDWRAHFGQGELPFYWVQLANYKGSAPDNLEYAFLREAQTQTLSLPQTGQAVSIDIGNPDNIHPANKQDVGLRLALLARNRTYGLPCEDTGPTFLRADREGAAFRVRFTHFDGASADQLLEGFEIAGADKQFFPASARAERDDTIVVNAPEVREPVAVRYAWRNAPKASLYNAAGLPAVPFRSDDW